MMKWLQLAIVVMCVTAALALVPGPCRNCFRCTQYAQRTYRGRICTKWVVQYYKARCGLWGWGRCTRSRRVCQQYKYIQKTRTVCIKREFRPGCNCIKP